MMQAWKELSHYRRYTRVRDVHHRGILSIVACTGFRRAMRSNIPMDLGHLRDRHAW